VAGTTYGIAKKATVHAVRVLNCQGSGTNADVIEGMDWVAANHVKPAVANMSLGGGASQATDDAVQRMFAAGVTVAVAAGNDNANACNYSPARAANAITVGSTTSTDARSSFSNYGTCLDIFAPGSSITSASFSSDTGSTSMSGTSMASPHVAGVAALYLGANPSATPQQVRDALVNNGTAGKVTSAGTGSPNVLLYSTFIGGGTTPPPDNVLTNGVATAAYSGASGSWKCWTLSVPTGKTSVVFNQAGGTGDADLYVKLGSAPTTSSYNCRPYLSGNTETCTISNPAAGTWYACSYGYSSYSSTTMKGTY
jgi:serine protease